MSELYRDFIDRKADAIITDLGGTITPAPSNAEFYRDFLNRKADDVITALNGSITPAPAGVELYRDFLNRKFDDVIAGIGGYIPTVSFPTVSGAVCSFDSQYAGLPLKSHTVDIDSVSGVSAINIGSDAKYAGFINFNQLVKNGNFETQSEWIGSRCNYTVSTNVATINITGAAGTTKQLYQTGDVIQDHKMFICLEANPSKETNVMFRVDTVSGSPEKQCTANVWTEVSGIKNITANTSNADVNIYGMTSLENGDTVQVRNAIVIDLTVMFGSTKADEIYNMEQQTAGSGVAYFRSLFPNDYYDYNAGTLTTVSAVNGSTNSFFTIPIGQTVNEGEYNARTGILEVTQPSVQTLQLPPCPIETLEVNNIFADTGDTTLQYIKIGGNT